VGFKGAGIVVTSRATLFLRGFIVLAALAVIVPLTVVRDAVPASAALPPPVPLGLNASTTDAWARQQTLTYRAKLTYGGTLTHIVMSVPTNTNFGKLRSSSGTVAYYRPNQIIWRPAKPLVLPAGVNLIIPVSGLTWRQEGTFPLWLTASTATGTVLTYGTGSITLVDRTTPCVASWDTSYIQTENAKPGTPGWQINPSTFDSTKLSAYSTKDSYTCGETAYIRVNAPLSTWVTAEVFRMGYYGGIGARRVWATGGDSLGLTQPAPVIVQGGIASRPSNMVDASSWFLTVGIRVDGSYAPGTYLVKITDKLGRYTYVPFTVRDDTGTQHSLLLQQGTTTWQAYNKFGGRSFYTTPGSAYLTFNRPYLEGQGSGQYLGLEYGLVYWLEKNNYDVGYWADMDLHFRSTEVASRAQTIILPAHDEYYSPNMRTGIVNAVAQGVNLVSFGANQMYRQIRPNTTGSQFEVYERWSAWPYSTTWRYRGQQYHEQAILGAEYGCPSNGTVTTNSSWMWAGVAPGTKLEGFVNGENDWVHPANQAPIPAGTKILQTAPLDYCTIPSETQRMDIVARTDAASGARVFGGSTFAYSCFLIASCPTNWRTGNPQVPLVVSTGDAAAVGQMVTRVLSWASTGDESGGAGLRSVPPSTEFISPEGGVPPQVVEQDKALPRP
jgi:hypothetical protein